MMKLHAEITMHPNRSFLTTLREGINIFYFLKNASSNRFTGM